MADGKAGKRIKGIKNKGIKNKSIKNKKQMIKRNKNRQELFENFVEKIKKNK